MAFHDVVEMEPANRLPESSGAFVDDGRGMQRVVEGSAEAGYIATPVSPLGQATAKMALGNREALEAEIDEMLAQIAEFWSLEPDEVLRKSSQLSARCTELCVLLHRVEARDRQFTRIRTMQVQPILEELDRQFKQHSRIVELRRQDLDLLRG